MKATGIVRRIDELGRVVVPKEIRRTLRIREGDPLEIFTNRDGEVILKKYSPIGELDNFAKQYAEALGQTSGQMIMICDRDQVVAASGGAKKENIGKKIAGGISIAVIAIFALILLGGSFYSLKENEYAVITTFGVPKVVEESGIHVKLPVIQELSRVPKTINGFTIGHDSDTGEYIDRESFMITRDYNFVNVDFYVEYRVTDPSICMHRRLRFRF